MINDSVKEELRPRLIEYVSQITTPSRKAGKNMFVCPLCGSGSHGGRNSDGAFHVTGATWYCHSCKQGGDIFKLIELHEGLSSFPDQVKRGADLLGVSVIETAKSDFSPEVKKEVKKPEVKKHPGRMTLIETFSKQINGSPAKEYLLGRGFNEETISRFMLGFNQKTGRVVIPYPGTDYKIERAISDQAEKKYLYPTGESIPIFMIKDGQSDYFYITEGQLDALSMYQVGAKNVIALGGGSYHLIEELLETTKIDGAVIVADRDPEEKREKDGLTPGERTAQNIEKTLTDHKIKSVIVYPPEGFKDSNDLLKADPERLKQLLADSGKQLLEAPSQGLKVINVGDYLTENFFDSDIAYFKKYKDRKIGFDNVDKYMTLYPGVACLGGASSLGKTTFAVNIVDNLLKKGESVIYFALEQLPIELITKSLARRVYEIDPFSSINNIDIKNGASSDALIRARSEYSQTAQKYQLVEGDFHFTAQTIVDYVEGYIKETGVRPIVVIDYLQLIAPPDGFKGTQREITDENLKAIKDLSKRKELFILLISSFNRASYKEPVGMESFKESGMIEYTCDYILGLQLSILEDSSFFTSKGTKGGERDNNNDKKEKKLYEAINQSPKEVELVALKNRNGRQRFKCFFKYKMEFDTFTPDMNSKYDPESASSEFQAVTDDEELPFEDV